MLEECLGPDANKWLVNFEKHVHRRADDRPAQASTESEAHAQARRASAVRLAAITKRIAVAAITPGQPAVNNLVYKLRMAIALVLTVIYDLQSSHSYGHFQVRLGGRPVRVWMQYSKPPATSTRSTTAAPTSAIQSKTGKAKGTVAYEIGSDSALLSAVIEARAR